jgi:hypothetical protein
MYIWKIGELKTQLSQGELPEPEAFKYLMANTVLYSLAAIQYFNANHYDTLSGFLSLCIAVIGLWFIYKCNGGENGKHIIHRYLSVGWVVFVRFAVLFILPVTVVFILFQELYLGGIHEETTLFDVFFMSAAEVIYFLWVAKHINYVAKQSNA